MSSPTFDLGSLCSSPLFYPEGEDFLGQPVNAFNDEDISFDFVDNFGTGFATVGKNINEVIPREHYQILTSESPTLRRNDNAGKENNNDQKTFSGKSRSNKQVIASNNGNRDSVDEQASASECVEVTDTKTENLHSNDLCKTAEGETLDNLVEQDATQNHALSRSDCQINGLKNGELQIVDNSPATTNSSIPNLHKHFTENTYPDNNFDEKTIFARWDLSSEGAHKPLSKSSYLEDLGEQDSKMTSLKKIDDSSFSVKNSAFTRRCVIPKTFYSPFWTPEKSTARQGKFVEDGFINAQRNVDILYCCNYRSQKRDAKNKRFAVKSDAGFDKDGTKYTDFLKRNSVFKQQGNSVRHHNKTINEVISAHIDDGGPNNDKWVSLPTIYNSSPKPRGLAPHHKKPTGGPFQTGTHSMSSIDELIKKYRGHAFDLVEQQKRYQIKPFK